MTDPQNGAPDGHDSQLVAVFEHRELAQSAHDALLSAGIPPGAVELVDHPGDPAVDHPGDPAVDDGHPRVEAETGFWAAISRLFAPNDEAHELSQAVGQGHVMIVVHPADAAEREVAIEALEGCGPLDLDERRTGWNPQATIEHQPIAVMPEVSEPARAEMVRIVEERLRVGWRDRPAAGRVRQYLAAKPQSGQRVELHEDDITPPSDPAARS